MTASLVPAPTGPAQVTAVAMPAAVPRRELSARQLVARLAGRAG